MLLFTYNNTWATIYQDTWTITVLFVYNTLFNTPDSDLPQVLIYPPVTWYSAKISKKYQWSELGQCQLARRVNNGTPITHSKKDHLKDIRLCFNVQFHSMDLERMHIYSGTSVLNTRWIDIVNLCLNQMCVSA